LAPEYDNGIVFKLSSSGTETILYSFQGGPSDGESPQGGLVMDSSGNLYGTTTGGGKNGDGTVFKLTSSGEETILYSFTSTNENGTWPGGTLILDKSGNLYGTTYEGGNFTCYSSDGCGTVFKVSSTGAGTILHVFSGSPDGALTNNYNGSLVADTNGNLYGTTLVGGSGTASLCKVNFFNVLGCGSVFKITLPNFSIAASPTTASVIAGESATSTLTISPVADFSGKVTLSCSLPSGKGLTCNVSPTSVTLDGLPEKATLTVDTATTTPAGSYKITAKGVGGTLGSLTHTATFTVTVQ
jgi:uncharacterized repeat protein (TIGR03803 family)